MTGFGRAQRDVGDIRVTCEMKSVNYKGLDVKVRTRVASLEPEIVQRLRASLERGRIDVTVDISRTHRRSLDEIAVRSVIDQIRRIASQVGAKGGLDEGDILRAALMLSPSDTIPSELPEALTVVDEALASLLAARANEGRHLHQFVNARIDAISALVERARERTAAAPDRFRERLTTRLAEVPVERLAQEIAILADRCDVTEELERLRAHVSHGRVLIEEDRCGRKLDFLCQELLREANTLGSKCQDAPTAHVVVELKSEIERMREQVQNVE